MRRLMAALALLAGLTLAGPEGLADGRDALVTVIVIDSDDGCTGNVERLTRALKAHLGGQMVGVEAYRVPELPERKAEQAAMARRAAGEGGVRAVVWARLDVQIVYLMLFQGDSERVVVREIPGLYDGLDPFCDAVASMVHSALSGMIDRTEEIPGGWAAAQMDDDEVPTRKVDPTPQPRVLEMGFGLEVGYGVVAGSGSRPSNHGARFAISYHITRHAGLEVTTDIPRAAEPDVAEAVENPVLVRWPVRLLVDGFLPTGRATFGLGLGATAEMVAVQDRDSNPLAREFDFTRWAFAVQVTGGVYVIDWLELRLGVTVDVFGSKLEWKGDVLPEGSFIEQEEVIFTAGIAQIYGFAALVFKWWWETCRPPRPPGGEPPRRSSSLP